MRIISFMLALQHYKAAKNILCVIQQHNFAQKNVFYMHFYNITIKFTIKFLIYF